MHAKLGPDGPITIVTLDGGRVASAAALAGQRVEPAGSPLLQTGQAPAAMPAAPRPRRAMVQNTRRWMDSSDVIPMFPTFAWKVQIEPGLRDALRETILAALAEMRAALPPLTPGHGWQSGQELHQREDFRHLVVCIDDGAASILRFLRIGDERYEITACWATVLARGRHTSCTATRTTTSAVSTMFALGRARTPSTSATRASNPA